MRRLNKKLTNSFFKDEDGYQKVHKFWAEKMKGREKIDHSAHLLYLVLMGKDWTRSFCGKSNTHDGGEFNSGAYRAVTDLHTYLRLNPSKIFATVSGDATLFSPEAANLLMSILPEPYAVLAAVRKKNNLPQYRTKDAKKSFEEIWKFYVEKFQSLFS